MLLNNIVSKLEYIFVCKYNIRSDIKAFLIHKIIQKHEEDLKNVFYRDEL